MFDKDQLIRDRLGATLLDQLTLQRQSLAVGDQTEATDFQRRHRVIG
jgi:hypothetical protein